MMNTKYILFNIDTEDAIFCSNDEGLLEEIMCDLFLEETYYNFCWRTTYENYNNIYELAAETWAEDIDYWITYVDILKTQEI